MWNIEKVASHDGHSHSHYTWSQIGHIFETSVSRKTSICRFSWDRTFGGGNLGLIRPQSRETYFTEHPLGLTLSRETSLFILAEVSRAAFFSERALKGDGDSPQLLWERFKEETQEIVKEMLAEIHYKINFCIVRLEKDRAELANNPDANNNNNVRTCHRRVGHDSKQTLLGVFRPLLVLNQVSAFRSEKESDRTVAIDIPRTGDST